MSQYAFHIDTSSCIGCKACEIACKDEKNLSVGVRPRFVRNFAGGGWTVENGVATPVDVFSYSVSMSCGHCDNPACVAVCPVGSMQKDPETGIVFNDPDTCIGCGACHEACPYKAPSVVKEENRTVKCDFCRALLAQGLAPACVETCPMRALDFGTYEEMKEKYGTDVRDIAPLPDSSETNPNIVITLHKDAKKNPDDGILMSLYRSE